MVPAVILAAGRSTRMGRLKATLPLGEHETFLTRLIGTFHRAGAEDVVVVVGHDAGAVVESVASLDLPVRFVLNPDFDSGQLSSTLAGLRAIDRPGVSAMLLGLVDAPLVSEATVRAILQRYRDVRPLVVRPVSRGRHGHPLIIDRRLFGELRGADPATGAKPVVHAHVSSGGEVEVDDEGAFIDIDTPEDYAAALRRPGSESGVG